MAKATKTRGGSAERRKAANHDVAGRLQAMVERIKRERTRGPARRLAAYDDHVVCYMDLLGFRHKVENMTIATARREIAKLDALLNRVIAPETGPEDEPFHIKVNYFSDCICFACSLSDSDLELVVDKLFYFLLHILHVQGELIFHDVVVRGAVTVDKHFANERLIFSKAQIRAYDLESRHVVYPMVLVDDSVFSAIRSAAKRKPYYPLGALAFQSDVADLFGLCSTDADGRSFVNYLGFWGELDDHDNIGPFFEKHKSLIETNARRYRSRPELLEKYRWMARYHDSYVQKMFKPESDLLIDGVAAFGKIDVPSEP
jgi:hypothetical protein